MKIARPTTILALLTALNFLNYVDRYLVAAVSPRFQESLGLNDFQTGLAISAFMVGYFVTSPLFGQLADSKSAKPGRRTVLIAVGVALWSVATVLSGFARDATTLVLARVLVGVGEASYATIAPTIIDDLAPPDRRNKWLTIFYLATPVGSALGYLLGGLLEHKLGWRAAFFVAGGPGIALAALALLVVEPKRLEKDEPTASTGAYRRLLGAPLYVACVAGFCMYTFALGGFAAWAPKFLYKTHAMELAKVDFGFGTVAVLAGIVGTIGGSWIADRTLPTAATEEERVRGYLRFCGWATLAALPFAVATIVAPTPLTFFVAIFLCEAALFASTSPINVVILGSVPRDLRATAMAASIFAIHAAGDFPSPPLIGWLADRSSLKSALMLLPVAVALCVVIWLRGARRPLARAE